MKPTFVLVHGAWGGAWIWRRILPGLRAAGHEVHAVTLTGVGERAHLRTPGIGLRTHIDDVVGLIRAEELDDIVLVGHSYGGHVVTGAADWILGEGVTRLHCVVHVDAAIPLPGESWSSPHAPEVVAQREALARANDGALPPPDPAGFGLSGEDRDWLRRRQVPHPFGPYHDRLDFDAERLSRVPRWFIDCHQPAYPTIDAARARARSMPGWTVVEMATGHAPMVSEPAGLTALLLAAAADSRPAPRG
jgi:pimeloyl-ACP methyl ester carboxylesterase